MSLPNIKLKFLLQRFLRLTNIVSKITFLLLLIAFLSGYYPTFHYPPIKKSVVKAQEPEQKQEVIPASFPQPVGLPVPGYLSTHFSSWHPGIDIATGLGMPIHPFTSGVVEQVNYDLFGYGNNVIIDHQNGFKSLYAHMGRVYVKVGDKLSSSNTIGEVGLTGRTSGPHLHLEVTKDGQYIDPMTILPSLPDFPFDGYNIAPTGGPEKPTGDLHKSLKPDFN